jgi:hypothetical protein
VAQGGGSGLMVSDGERGPIGRLRPRDLKEQLLPGSRELGPVHCTLVSALTAATMPPLSTSPLSAFRVPAAAFAAPEQETSEI